MNIEPIATPLDYEAVQTLALQFLNAIHAHYRSRPTARATAQEVLNALGSTAAIVIHGAGSPESRLEACEFFDRAIQEQLADLAQSHPDEAIPS